MYGNLPAGVYYSGWGAVSYNGGTYDSDLSPRLVARINNTTSSSMDVRCYMSAWDGATGNKTINNRTLMTVDRNIGSTPVVYLSANTNGICIFHNDYFFSAVSYHFSTDYMTGVDYTPLSGTQTVQGGGTYEMYDAKSNWTITINAGKIEDTQWNALKNRVTALESGTQKKLTAGDNITIDTNNTISAHLVNADWTETEIGSKAYIEHKPFQTIGKNLSVVDGALIAADQQQSDWNEVNTTKATYIKNKPSIPAFPDDEISLTSTNSIQNSTIVKYISNILGLPYDDSLTVYNFLINKPERYINTENQVLLEYFGINGSNQYFYQTVITFNDKQDKNAFHYDWRVGALDNSSVAMSYRNRPIAISHYLYDEYGPIEPVQIKTYRYNLDGTVVELDLPTGAKFDLDTNTYYSGIIIANESVSFIKSLDSLTLYNTDVCMYLNNTQVIGKTQTLDIDYNFTFNYNIYIPWYTLKDRIQDIRKVLGNSDLKTTAQTIIGAINELEQTKIESIPKATTTTLGTVIPDGSTITIDQDGVISSSGGGGQQPYTLPIATISRLGGIKPDGTTLSVDENTGIASVIGGGGGAGYIITVEGYQYSISQSIDANGDLIQTYTLIS